MKIFGPLGFFAQFAFLRWLKKFIIVDVLHKEGRKDYSRPIYEAIRDYVGLGMRCVDVGVNRGEMSVRMLKRVGFRGSVVGIEPLPVMCEYLRKRFRRHPNFRLIEAAALDHPAESVELFLTKNPDASSLSYATEGISSIRVPAIAIDSLKLCRLDFLKVDVEGFDLEVLRGAESTIRKFRPVIVVECWPNFYKEPDILDFFKRCEYRTTRLPNDILALPLARR